MEQYTLDNELDDIIVEQASLKKPYNPNEIFINFIAAFGTIAGTLFMGGLITNYIFSSLSLGTPFFIISGVSLIATAITSGVFIYKKCTEKEDNNFKNLEEGKIEEKEPLLNVQQEPTISQYNYIGNGNFSNKIIEQRNAQIEKGIE